MKETISKAYIKFLKEYRGTYDMRKDGKTRRIENNGYPTSVTYSATFKRKSDATRFKKWSKQEYGANHTRIFKSAEGYEVWMND